MTLDAIVISNILVGGGNGVEDEITNTNENL